MASGNAAAARRPAVLVLHELPDPVEAALDAAFAVTRRSSADPAPVAELAEAAARFDALVPTVTDRLPAAVFEAADRRLRLVANFGVGVEHIDLEAARRAGVAVTNTPGVLTDCTADLTVALMLMALRRLGEGERLVRGGGWTGWRPVGFLGRRVTGLTLGIVGFGRIGRAVAARARHGFGMRVLYHSRSAAPPDVAAALGAERRGLDELLAEADVVSLHCPATPETVRLLDARRLARMKPGAVLVNTARGVLVDEAALAEALREGRLLAAGLDVFADEPRVPEALLALENVVLLPHLGSGTVETRTDMGQRVVANLRAFFDGRPPPDLLTPA
jgi:lactate dehydrogenase-like 2-hydroxyacid dehydrogenase